MRSYFTEAKKEIFGENFRFECLLYLSIVSLHSICLFPDVQIGIIVESDSWACSNG